MFTAHKLQNAVSGFCNLEDFQVPLIVVFVGFNQTVELQKPQSFQHMVQSKRMPLKQFLSNVRCSQRMRIEESPLCHFLQYRKPGG